ncbi:MAG: cytochrome b/b6 domain-containing protein [Pseudomonadota bacterium]
MDSHHQHEVPIWDMPIRLFHWLLVAGFTGAYLTAKYAQALHVLIGYLLCALLLLRLIWGLIGSRYARFGSFIFSPRATFNYIRAVGRGNPPHHYGHNPAGALMVFALLGLLLLISATGLMTLAVIDYEGPLVSLTQLIDDKTSYLLRRLHRTLTNVVLLLIVLHLAGVLLSSIQHRENLVRAMLTGRKKRYPPLEKSIGP